jgi:glutamate carboxypeptidase
LTGRQLIDVLRDETAAMVAETERLARIDSGTDDPDGVARVSDAIGEMLTARGFDAHPTGGGGLEATLAVGAGPRLLILGHADTVWPSGTAAGWPTVVADGMLAGPGVGDMKGCVVMAIHAVSAAVGAGADGIGEVVLLVTPDEEHGSTASRSWIEERARTSTACLGLEAGWPGGGVVVERGAVGALRAVGHGRAAHCAGHEDRGASAVAALARLVGALESLSDPEKGVLVTIGRFSGGVARQVVPDHAELLIDLRAPDAQAATALVERVRGIVESHDGDGDGVGIELEGGITRPAFPRHASDLLWRLAERRAEALGIPLGPVSSRGGSDASFAAALGVPTLDGLGPICHDSCSRAERIEIASLAERGALMAGLLVDLAARWRGGAAGGD